MSKTISPLLLFPLGSAGLLSFYSCSPYFVSFVSASTVLVWRWEGGGAMRSEIKFLSLYNLLPCFCLHLKLSIDFILPHFSSECGRWVVESCTMGWGAKKKRGSMVKGTAQSVNWRKGQTKYRANKRKRKAIRLVSGLRRRFLLLWLVRLYRPFQWGFSTAQTSLPSLPLPLLTTHHSLTVPFWLARLLFFRSMLNRAHNCPLGCSRKEKNGPTVRGPIKDQNVSLLTPTRCTSSPKDRSYFPGSRQIQFRSLSCSCSYAECCILTGAACFLRAIVFFFLVVGVVIVGL